MIRICSRCGVLEKDHETVPHEFEPFRSGEPISVVCRNHGLLGHVKSETDLMVLFLAASHNLEFHPRREYAQRTGQWRRKIREAEAKYYYRPARIVA